jgi:hypothetical protein
MTRTSRKSARAIAIKADAAQAATAKWILAAAALAAIIALAGAFH